MLTRNRIGAIGGSLILATLAACGGGSSDGMAGIDGTGAPAPGTVISVGAVTGFGSVIVNGVRFDTTGTSFTIDGAPGSQSDLAVGDIVVVRGTLSAANSSQGTATSISFDDAVEGPIAAIDAANGTLTVLGQTVRVGAETSFDDSIQPPSLAGLSVGDLIEVSGLVGADGSISATRIEPKNAIVQFELTGTVSNLDTATMRFSINAQVVDYSSAQLVNFNAAAIADGDFVEVKAGITLGPGGELLATRVELKGNGFGGANGNRVEVEGLITRFASITDFDVAGFPVTSNGNPSIEGGVAGDLGLNVKVEVEGTLQNGVLNATRIDIRRASNLRLFARVDSVDAATNRFVTLGITVRVDARTRLEDKSSSQVDRFSIGDLATGNYVEVRGSEIPAGSGGILAALLEREDPDTRIELQGFVTAGSVVNPVFSILGVTISTNGGTSFRDTNDAPISAAAFFAAAEGSLVKVYGAETGTAAILAEEVELESP